MTKKTTMKIAKTNKSAKTPTRKHETDAGLDLYSLKEYTINVGETEIVETGIAIEFPLNTMGLIKPKSRHSYLVGAGVVDQDYRGEIKVKVFNSTKDIIKIKKHDPVAQIVILPILTPFLEVVPYRDLKSTKRGQTGGINN